MSGSLATELATLQATANTYAPLDGVTPGTVTLSPGDLYPGSGGSVTDAAGNVFTLPQMDGLPNFGWVTENGDPVPNGDYSAALTSSNGQIFAEDLKTANWYTLQNGQFVSASDPGDTSGNSSNVPGSGSTVGTGIVDSGTGVNQSGAASNNSNTGNSNGGSTANIVTPGSGSFIGPTPDGGTGTYSIDPNGDVADLNGQPLTPDGGSSGTGVLELTTDQMVVGQDESSGNWFQLVSKGTQGLFEWQSTGAPAGAATTPAASTPSPLGGSSMQFIAPNTNVASIDFSHSCGHG